MNEVGRRRRSRTRWRLFSSAGHFMTTEISVLTPNCHPIKVRSRGVGIIRKTLFERSSNRSKISEHWVNRNVYISMSLSHPDMKIPSEEPLQNSGNWIVGGAPECSTFTISYITQTVHSETFLTITGLRIQHFFIL